MTTLEQEIKELIISSLALEDVSPDDIVAADPLFVDGLGLDSIDGLELGMALQRRYGVTMNPDAKVTREHFANLNALVAFVSSQRIR